MKITDEDLKSNLAEFYRRKKEGAYYGIVDAPTLEAIMLDLQSARAKLALSLRQIEDAPHYENCASSSYDYQFPCNCWKFHAENLLK